MFKFLRFFTFSYWRRREAIKTRWFNRNISIKHIFKRKLMISHTVLPNETESFNNLQKHIRNEINKNYSNKPIGVDGVFDHHDEHFMQKRFFD